MRETNNSNGDELLPVIIICLAYGLWQLIRVAGWLMLLATAFTLHAALRVIWVPAYLIERGSRAAAPRAWQAVREITGRNG